MIDSYHCIVCGYNGSCPEVGLSCPQCGRVCKSCDSPVVLVSDGVYACKCRSWVE